MKLKVVKPNYIYLKLTPNNSVRNNSTHKIARTISSIYRGLFQRIRVIGKEIVFQSFEKVSYFVYMEKKKVEFYFVVPENMRKLFEEKMTDSWSNITVEEVKEFPLFNKGSESFQLVYEKEDALSLAADKRDNDLLRSNLNVTNVIEDGDRIGIMYNFIPASQHWWKSKYKETIRKVNDNEPVERNKSGIVFIAKYGLIKLSSFVDGTLNALSDKKQTNDGLLSTIADRIGMRKELTNETRRKENNVILKMQAVIISDSSDKIRRINNAKSVTQSFETISGDNRLIAKKCKYELSPDKYMIKGIATNIVSDSECNNFISLAGRDILEEYDFIEKVSTKETQVPNDLMKGKFRIGENTFRGNKQEAFLSDDKEFQYLSLILIGPNRSGKSTLIGNLGKDAIDYDEVVINFDFIGNCELSEEMSSLFPKGKTLNIECDDFSKMQGLGYNEIDKGGDKFKRYANTKLQTTQLTTLVNSINTDDQPLTTRMERYLQSASNVVFSSNGSIKNVFEVLQDHKARNHFISIVESDQLENLKEYIDALHELDEVNKEGVVNGTRYSRVDGIIDRLNKLKANPYMEQMLKRDTKNNINLVDEFQKSQLINIKMPETMFGTDNEKDVYTTYWMTKIWLALQVRKAKYKDNRNDMKKVNMFIDELYQVENTEKFITSKLSRLPKFNIKPVISCHYLNQIKHIREELRSANASYMLIAGCDKKNFKELESELYPFKEEDLLKLQRFHSLNLIKTKDGYGRFITKLPKPIK